MNPSESRSCFEQLSAGSVRAVACADDFAGSAEPPVQWFHQRAKLGREKGWDAAMPGFHIGSISLEIQ